MTDQATNTETLEQMAARLAAKAEANPAPTPEQAHEAYLAALESQYGEPDY